MMDIIQSLPVMLLTVSADSERMVWHSLTITWSRVLKISLRNPRFRISFQICSMGFISGVAGGRKMRRMFSGITSALDVCQDALSPTRIIRSFGYLFDNSRRNTFMHSVLQYGIMRKNESPV